MAAKIHENGREMPRDARKSVRRPPWPLGANSVSYLTQPTTLSLFNLLAVPTPHLLSLFLARQPSPPWKSQIAHLDIHHLVFGIDFQIHSVSLTILVSIHILIHPLLNSSLLSSPLSSSITPSLFHSRPKTYLFNKSHRRFLLSTWLPHDNGTITLIILFLVSNFNFSFIPCGID